MHLVTRFSLLFILMAQQLFAQDSIVNKASVISPTAATEGNGKFVSPYKISWKVDAPIIVGGIGLTALGVKLINDKSNLTPAQLVNKTPENVPFFDRSSAGWYSERADLDSYIPFQGSFAVPIVMSLINKNERQNIAQVMVLYLETMAITGTLFTMAAGNINRSRPYVYGTLVDNEMRMDKNSQRAFYAGHTAAAAAAMFFSAKVFSDFNPNSKAKVYVWIGAAAVPAVVGYLRYKAGMHFLSDNILGYAIGAATGILVPQLHKTLKVKNLSMIPQVGTNYQGVALTYKIK